MLRALPRKDQQGVRFVPPDNWHVTLRFLGDEQSERVEAAMHGVSLPAARARVGPGVDVLGRHSVIAPVAGLDDVAAAVVAGTDGLGEVDARSTFTGHITIARVRRGAIVRNVVGLPCAAEFEVREVALVESQLRPTGARYQTLATWPTMAVNSADNACDGGVRDRPS